MDNEYIRRTIEKEISSMAADYPVVTLVGPRQSGKTTVAKYLFPHKIYRSLESSDIRALAEEDPRRFLNDHQQGMIIDEIQRSTQLLSYIPGYLRKISGKFFQKP